MLLKLSAVAVLAAASVWGQNVISARSGVVNYLEGVVTLDGKELQPKFGEFPEIKKQQTLATDDGRAEILLNPGVFLRISEKSSMEMIDNQIEDTHVALVAGHAIVEAAEMMKYNAATFHVGENTISIIKAGLYRIDVEEGRVRVYDGELRVTSAKSTISLRKGKEVRLGELLLATNFDPKSTDPFFRWGARRAETVARANPSAARNGSCFAATNCTGWVHNPWLGIITYIPNRNVYCNYFGDCYYSPSTVYAVYAPRPVQGPPAFNGNPAAAGDFSGGNRSAIGNASDGRVGAGSVAAPSAPAATGVSAAPAVSAPASGGRGR